MYCGWGVFAAFGALFALLFARAVYLPSWQIRALRWLLRHAARRANVVSACLQICIARGRCHDVLLHDVLLVCSLQNVRSTFGARRGGSLLFFHLSRLVCLSVCLFSLCFHSFLPHFLTSYLPTFLPSYFPTFLTSCFPTLPTYLLSFLAYIIITSK